MRYYNLIIWSKYIRIKFNKLWEVFMFVVFDCIIIYFSDIIFEFEFNFY